jgi:hypothetical protein
MSRGGRSSHRSHKARTEKKRYWDLYEHLRLVHDMDAIILGEARSTPGLRYLHKHTDRLCHEEWERIHE